MKRLNPSESPPDMGRLDRMLSYLDEDPGNSHLLVETFDLAIAVGAHDRAADCLKAAASAGLSSAEWTYRGAMLCIASKQLKTAEEILMGLYEGGEASPMIVHGLAWIAFVEGRWDDCCARLRTSVEETLSHECPWPSAQRGALQLLWLRAMHHRGPISDSWAWVLHAQSSGLMQPEAIGAASLIAVDANQLSEAAQLASKALEWSPDQMEALQAAATVSIAQKNTAAAKDLLARALSQNSNNGRAWSALSYAELLDLRPDVAQEAALRALESAPQHIGTWHMLGWSRIALHDYLGALQAFENALALNHNFGETHGAIAVALCMLRRRSEAETAVRRALRLNRSSGAAQFAQAILEGALAAPGDLKRVAKNILENRTTALGEAMFDWVSVSRDGE